MPLLNLMQHYHLLQPRPGLPVAKHVKKIEESQIHLRRKTQVFAVNHLFEQGLIEFSSFIGCKYPSLIGTRRCCGHQERRPGTYLWECLTEYAYLPRVGVWGFTVSNPTMSHWLLNNSCADGILQRILPNLVHIQAIFSTPRYWNVQILCTRKSMHGWISNIFIFPSLPLCVYVLISRVAANQLVCRLSTYISHQLLLENMSFERTSCIAVIL